MNDTIRKFCRNQPGWICRSCTRLKNRSGFTLLELILVMVLLGIAAVMIAPFVGHIFSNLLEGRELSHRESQAALALERFVRDIREAPVPIEDSTNGKKVLKAKDNKIYIIDSGDLFFVDKDKKEYVLVRNLAGDSEFLVNTDQPYVIVTLKLKILMSNGGILELSASSIPRQSL